ncbi:MAG: 3-oxoacyl-(Acyl-carrier-protein) reductase [Candidatus Magasanikbacteria bacterium GW2011_GWC2_45_8]|uniref:3-oxoacyl-(Acyl-carrier-protein) reductase n=1 Tax=Candidatus Magasanikbacteria bacterium GW2011_GWC2_45_8 TaxID=1619050 RepID=A0A0G1Q811_9BACT|nr:MAG: 3-oxoacyl-(Acyl-carrier-protein) reductase [Candidatus Magasanikbacteria bacterium GW2011_GWC2_45_8]
MDSNLLQDKIILVTGASRGIGRAIARASAFAGACVILNYRGREAGIKSVVNELKKLNKHTIAVRADVSNSKDVKKMFSIIKKRFGRLDVLVNNAGIRRDSLLMNTAEKDWDDVLDVNLKGTFLCMKETVKLMLLSGGRIINITSIVGTNGNPGQAAYSASKAGIIGLTKSASKELGPIGITVNAIAPGLIDTDMVANLTSEQRAKLIKNTPLARSGTADEVASAAVFLASEMAAYVNGQVIGVDGGMIM